MTCTSYALSAGTGTFSGCSGGTGSVAAGNYVGGPGAAIATSATLSAIGEGSTKQKTLFKNNEDYTALRAAYTTNGVNFRDLGIITGTDPTNQTDINNPASQAQPSTSDHDLPLGAQDDPELRYVDQGHHHLELRRDDRHVRLRCLAVDGDRDAFNEIFYTTSTDGIHWSTPVVVESTDYTFSTSAAAGAGNLPTTTQGYYEGGRGDCRPGSEHSGRSPWSSRATPLPNRCRWQGQHLVPGRSPRMTLRSTARS